jgi:hypothetical protein
MVAQGCQTAVPLTLSAYMIRRFEGPHATEQHIGLLTGLLVRWQEAFIPRQTSFIAVQQSDQALTLCGRRPAHTSRSS